MIPSARQTYKKARNSNETKGDNIKVAQPEPPHGYPGCHGQGKTMTIYCNSGVTTTRKQGHLKGYGHVRHNPTSIANTISLGECSARYRITTDTDIDNALHAHKSDGSVRIFECTKAGIYCCNMQSSCSI